MALIKPNGNYIRILSVHPFDGLIILEKWESKKHRMDGGNEFHRPIVESYQQSSITLDIMPDASLTLRDNILRAAYLSLKLDNQFIDCDDDL